MFKEGPKIAIKEASRFLFLCRLLHDAFNRHFHSNIKCGCADVMIISLSNVFKEVKLKRMVNERIRRENIGCTGKKKCFCRRSKTETVCAHKDLCFERRSGVPNKR